MRPYAALRGSGLSAWQERAIALGLTALLGLVMTRAIIGARVAFFDPFLSRGIETAVGLCAAILVVVVGLLTWPAWLPPFLAGSRSVLAGHWSLGHVAEAVEAHVRTLVRQLRTAKTAIVLTLVAIGVLAYPAGTAPLWGFLVGGVVLLAWVCVAWVVSFTSPFPETFERGAYSVVEQTSPPLSSTGGIREAVCSPEAALLFVFTFLTFAHAFYVLGMGVAFVAVVILAVLFVARPVWLTRALSRRFLPAILGIGLFGGVIGALRWQSVNGSPGAFVLAVFVALASVRIGRGVAARVEAAARSGRGSGRLGWLVDAALLTLPLFLMVMLLGVIDMGLVLVLVIPIGFATALAAGITIVRSRLLLPGVAIVVLGVMGKYVIYPSLEPIRNAMDHAEQAVQFATLSAPFGIRLPFLSTSLDRAAARSVATRDRELAETLLVAAAPGAARDLLRPSIEQIWGARAYSQSGWLGEGLGRAVIGGRGIAETVSYAENTFAVFVLGEHGALAGLLVLALYLLLTVAVAILALRPGASTASYRASRALYLVAALMVAFPASYVALSNLGVVPITGQNMPFLGLNAWSDAAICAGVVGILITGTLRGIQETWR